MRLLSIAIVYLRSMAIGTGEIQVHTVKVHSYKYTRLQGQSTQLQVHKVKVHSYKYIRSKYTATSTNFKVHMYKYTWSSTQVQVH